MPRTPKQWTEIKARMESTGYRCEACDRPCRRFGEAVEAFIEAHKESKWGDQLEVTYLTYSEDLTQTFDYSTFTLVPFEVGSNGTRVIRVICGKCWLEHKREGAQPWPSSP